MRATFCALVVSIVACAACGARTSLGTPQPDGGDGDVTPIPRNRVCPPECFAGHQCCTGGCSGPAAPMPSDCCECLPGETTSMLCANAACGG